MTKSYFVMAFTPRPGAPVIQWVRAYVAIHPGDDRLNAIAAMESEYPSGVWIGFKDVDSPNGLDSLVFGV